MCPIEYPKVLIVSLSRVNARDTNCNSLLLKNLFAGWPKDRIAQIWSGGSNGDEGHWGRYYEIKREDRRFGKLFFKLKGEAIKSACASSELKTSAGTSSAGLIKRLGKAMLLEGGLYELIFSLRISKEMRAFIEGFSPDLIFAQGYSLGFAWLPVTIRDLTGKPICFHTSDDWPGDLYANRTLSWLMRPIVLRQTRRLLRNSSLCFGFSPAMCAAYEQRYGTRFQLLMNGDDYARFKNASPVEKPPGELRIVYSGSVGYRRWETIVDLCEAVKELRGQGLPIEVYVYALNMTAEIKQRFEDYTFLHLPAHPPHEELPAHLKAADILFLPESFDEGVARRIALSVSSKAQLYMMSERPILVYSHPATGISQYAASEKWALVLSQRDISALGNAVKALLEDRSAREKLAQRGTEVALRRHDLRTITDEFASQMQSAARRH